VVAWCFIGGSLVFVCCLFDGCLKLIGAFFIVVAWLFPDYLVVVW